MLFPNFDSTNLLVSQYERRAAVAGRGECRLMGLRARWKVYISFSLLSCLFWKKTVWAVPVGANQLLLPTTILLKKVVGVYIPTRLHLSTWALCQLRLPKTDLLNVPTVKVQAVQLEHMRQRSSPVVAPMLCNFLHEPGQSSTSLQGFRRRCKAELFQWAFGC